MTTQTVEENDNGCPAEGLLRMLSGKWKPQIFRLATEQSLRFNSLLRQIQGSNKQSLSVALKELEEVGILEKIVIQLKPLHIEYHLTEKGKSLIPIFVQLEGLS